MSLGIGHANHAALDLEDAPRSVSQLKNVANVRFDRKVLVERSDEESLRILKHAIIGNVGNGPAAGDGGDAGTLAGHDPPAHRVAMEQAVATVDVQVDDGVKILPREPPIRPGADQCFEQRLLVPPLLPGRDACRHDLLRENIERGSRLGRAIQLAPLCGAQQRRGLDQFVDGQREQAALWNPSHGMPGSADALEKRRDRSRGSDLNHQIDIADIDAQFQRSGRHQREASLISAELLRPAAALWTGCCDGR